MRYHFISNDFEMPRQYGKLYWCEHPVYSRCLLYQLGENETGLAVIQQRYNDLTKITWWDEPDPQVGDAIYLHPEFQKLYAERSGPGKDGIFPTMTVRQVMWALKMKPLPKERWETVFDRRDI